MGGHAPRRATHFRPVRRGGRAVAGLISVAGGRMDTFDFNTGMHVVYDPNADRWQERAPMPTPRHAMGAAVVGDAIHVPGGGPMNGGSFQSSAHEVFRL